MNPKPGNEPLSLFRSPKCHARTHKGAACPNFARQNGRCRRHGGLSTGPRSPEGLQRSRMARWIHGDRCAASRANDRAMRAFFKEAKAVLLEAREATG
ncbi:MAG: HGGxSTG domain-containing protein [Candidatus Melainabacteria bacterium]